MKGKATLVLADAKTGEVIRRVEEENLVTNAITNIFNPPHYMLMHNMDYSKLFTTGLPLWEDLMGGIMLLGNNVPENADSFMLGTDTVPVATAGGEYVGDSATRGTLNVNESYATENGYRFTWDFGTDVANGTIKCVGLTSKEFGDTGFLSQGSKYGSFAVVPHNIGTTGINADTAFEYGLGQYIGTFEPFVHLYAELDPDGNLVLRRYRSVDPSAIGINSVTGLSAVSEPISVKTVATPIKLKYDQKFFLDTDSMTVQYFAEPVNNYDDTMNVSYCVLDIKTLSFVKSETFVMPHFSFSHAALWKNRLYFSSQNRLHSYTTGGTLVSSLEYEDVNPTRMFTYNGCLMADYGNDVVCLSWGENPCKMYFNSYIFPTYSVDVKAPYVTGAQRHDHSTGSSASVKARAMFYIISSYMATINNLSEPLEKTSAHTLKIIYEITN